MSSHTDYRLSEIDSGPLEDLAIDLLTRTDRYRGVDPQGGRGKDGGKDGLLLGGPEDKNTIVHVSRRKDWQGKLKEDLDKAANHDRDYHTFVYVTNQIITGNQKPIPDVARPFVDEHGWEIDVWDGKRLQSELDNNHQDLRKQYLEIARDEDPSKMAARLIDERLRLIGQRSHELPRPIQTGPTAILHLIPHDVVANDVDITHDELPAPSISGQYPASTYSRERTLDGVVGFATEGPDNSSLGYLYYDIEGWVEMCDASIRNEGKKTLAGSRFESVLADSYKYGKNALDEMGFDGPFEVGVSVLSVRGYSFAKKERSGLSPSGSMKFRQDHIKAKPYTIKDAKTPAGKALKQVIDRIWRGARWQGGSPNYYEDGWIFEP